MMVDDTICKVWSLKIVEFSDDTEKRIANEERGLHI